jgi:hypothetical protein
MQFLIEKRAGTRFDQYSSVMIEEQLSGGREALYILHVRAAMNGSGGRRISENEKPWDGGGVVGNGAKRQKSR